MSMDEHTSIGAMGWISVGSAVAAAVILITFLWKRPAPGANVRLALLLGLGVFPILSAGTANLQGFTATQSRTFCGSCHVMEPYRDDSHDPTSSTLAAVHARNSNFGHDNCYTCHKDYGMYGYVLTKWGGMGHVYYYLTEYHSMSLEESKHSIHIRKPLPNANCMSCHTTTAPGWSRVTDHASALELVRTDQLSCASPGCHGSAHPFNKLEQTSSARQP